MPLENNVIADFKPRFDGLEKDLERYENKLIAMADSGEIVRPKGQSLATMGLLEAGRALLEDAYFAREMYDEIERYHTASGEIAFGWPDESTRAVMDRFTALGETARTKRLWRTHVAHLKGIYWQYISALKQDPEATAMRARLAEYKTLLLDIMAAYGETLSPGDERERARLDRDREDVADEVRRLPPGKVDGRKMDEALFWDIVETGLSDGAPIADRIDAITDRLALFKPATIKAFQKQLLARLAESYRSDVWALAYLLQDGCSDDAFHAFRAWLILRGRAVFAAALTDPDGFDVALHTGPTDGAAALIEAAPIAHDMRAGKPMPPPARKRLKLGGPDLDESEFATALPTIAAKTRTG